MSRIRDWELLLPLYIPGLLQYQIDHPEVAQSSENAEDYKIWLPSAIPPPHRPRITMPDLIFIETELRFAQMNDSLNAMRQILKIKSRMVEFKNKNIRGQHGGTRSRAVIDRIHDKARASAAKYRVARTAYMALVGPGIWEDTFKVLNDGDIRGYRDPEHLRPRVGRRGILEDGQIGAEAVDEEPGKLSLFNEPRSRRDGTGETRRTISWIWNVVEGNTGRTEDRVDTEIQRVEWCKSRARAARMSEEVRLLKEEMRRALAFLDWKANWWKERQHVRQGESKSMVEAVTSYATSQERNQRLLAANFRKLWEDPFRKNTADDRDEDGEDDDDDDESGGEDENEAEDEDEDEEEDEEEDEDKGEDEEEDKGEDEEEGEGEGEEDDGEYDG